MYFKFECTSCRKNLKISDEYVGRKTRCPYCNAAQIVPEPPRPETESSTALEKSDRQDLPSGEERLKDQAPTGEVSQGGEGGAKESVSGTDVSTLKSFLLGAVMTGIFYGALYPLGEDNYFYELFYERGWVPVVEALLMFFCFAVLFLKSRKIRKQRQSMLFDMLPSEVGEDIGENNVIKFMDHLRSLPIDSSQSFLLNRVRRGLEHYRVRRSAAEVTTMLASQADIDQNEVDTSYTLINTALWAIPILGFIGTVIGIGIAVGQLSAAMAATEELSKLKDALGGMTSGLSTAFDTTLIGLVMSTIVMFIVKPIQKAEESLLNWVSEYCNENLIKRLKDAGAGTEQEVGHPDNLKAIRKVVDASMADHHAELETWTKKLEQIGIALTQQAAKGWGDIHKELVEELKAKENEINESMTGVGERQAGIIERIDELQARVIKVQEDQIKAAVEADVKRNELRDEAAGSMVAASEALTKHVGGMDEALKELNRTLSDLGSKQISIEAVIPAKKGWSFFGGKGK